MAVAAAHCSCSRSLQSLSSSLSPSKRGAISKRVSVWPSPAPRSVKSVHRLLCHLPRRFSAADSAFFPSASSIAEKYTSATENSPSSMTSPLESSGGEISSTDISIPEISLEQNQKIEKGGSNQLNKRVVFGLGIGLGAGGVVVAGGWVFTAAMAAVVLAGSREFFELVRSRRIADGMALSSRYAPVYTIYVLCSSQERILKIRF